MNTPQTSNTTEHTSASLPCELSCAESYIDTYDTIRRIVFKAAGDINEFSVSDEDKALIVSALLNEIKQPEFEDLLILDVHFAKMLSAFIFKQNEFASEIKNCVVNTVYSAMNYKISEMFERAIDEYDHPDFDQYDEDMDRFLAA